MNAPVTEPAAAAGVLSRRGPEILAASALAGALLRNPASWPEGALILDLALSGCLLLLWHQGRLLAPRGPLLVLAAALGALSLSLSADRGAAALALVHEARLVGAFWVGCSLAAPGEARRALPWLVTSVASAAAVHGAWQLFVAHPRLAEASRDLLPPGMRAQLLDGRTSSVFVLPAHLGSFLALALPFALFLAWRTRGRLRALAIALLVLLAGGHVASASFGGLLLSLGGVGTFVLLAMTPKWRSRSLLLGGVVAAALLAAGLARRDAEIEREAPWSARARNWETAARLAREQPLFGLGPGSFGIEHARARPEASNDVQHAHQDWLQAAAEQGIVMVALLAAFVARMLLAAQRRGALTDPSEAAMAAAVAVVLAESILDFAWMTVPWGIPAAALLGAAMDAASAERRARGWRLAAVLAGVASLLTADALIAASRRSAESASSLAREGRHEEARELLQRAARLSPLDDRRWRELGGAELQLARQARDDGERRARLDAALAHARRAVSASPRKAAGHALLAMILRERGDLPAAAAAARRAAELAPWDPGHRERRDEAMRRLGGDIP